MKYLQFDSAVNIDWENNIENDMFKDIEKLSKIYSKIPKEANVVTYCQGGYRAANAFVALKMLGYEKVKIINEGIVWYIALRKFLWWTAQNSTLE